MRLQVACFFLGITDYGSLQGEFAKNCENLEKLVKKAPTQGVCSCSDRTRRVAGLACLRAASRPPFSRGFMVVRSRDHAFLPPLGAVGGR